MGGLAYRVGSSVVHFSSSVAQEYLTQEGTTIRAGKAEGKAIMTPMAWRVLPGWVGGWVSRQRSLPPVCGVADGWVGGWVGGWIRTPYLPKPISSAMRTRPWAWMPKAMPSFWKGMRRR